MFVAVQINGVNGFLSRYLVASESLDAVKTHLENTQKLDKSKWNKRKIGYYNTGYEHPDANGDEHATVIVDVPKS